MTSVDVVVPCYQYGSFLRDCVGSIQRQDIDNLRILIIDNASSDDSAEVAKQLASEDRRIEVVVRKKNLGPNASYNEGIDWAVGDYMMIVDADDLVANGCIAPAVSFLEHRPEVAFAYGTELQAEFAAGVVPWLDPNGPDDSQTTNPPPPPGLRRPPPTHFGVRIPIP